MGIFVCVRVGHKNIKKENLPHVSKIFLSVASEWGLSHYKSKPFLLISHVYEAYSYFKILTF
jgi:hypothetical protein